MCVCVYNVLHERMAPPCLCVFLASTEGAAWSQGNDRLLCWPVQHAHPDHKLVESVRHLTANACCDWSSVQPYGKVGGPF